VEYQNQFTGSLPLVEAAKFGHLDIVEILLVRGADPDAKSAEKIGPRTLLSF